MRLWKRKVTPTLLLSETGVLVEAVEQHLFPPGGQQAPAHHQQVQVPPGAAAVAVQFVHEIGARFSDLQVFRLSYFNRAPGQDLWEEYLAVPFDRLRFAAAPAGTEVLTQEQRRVLATLLGKSDPQAWDASEPVRMALQ